MIVSQLPGELIADRRKTHRFFRARRGEKHIKFYFEKYLMAFADQIVKILVLKKSGWVSYSFQPYG